MMNHQCDYASSFERERAIRRLSHSEPALLPEVVVPPMGPTPASLLRGRVDLLDMEAKLIESLLARRLAGQSSSSGAALSGYQVTGHCHCQNHQQQPLHLPRQPHKQMYLSSQQQQPQLSSLSSRGLLMSPAGQRLIQQEPQEQQQQQNAASGLKMLSTATSYSLPSHHNTAHIHQAVHRRVSLPTASSSTTDSINSECSFNIKNAATTTTTCIPKLVTIPSSPPTPPSQPIHSAKKGRYYITEIYDLDVIGGRGGLSNHHPGNKKFRQVVQEMKAAYRQTEAKTLKTDLSRAIVEHVCSYGGRFVKKETDGTNRYYVLTKAEARKKTSQALRETKQLKWAYNAY